MGVQPGRRIHQRLPKPVFNTIEQLDRTRSMMLALPVKKYSKQIPFGYKVKDDDPKILEPVEEHFQCLLQAKEYLKTCSYEEVSKWLATTTGMPLSPMGLYKIMTNRHPVPEVSLPIEEREKI